MQDGSLAAADYEAIHALLTAEGWTLDQVDGQLKAIKRLASSEAGFVRVIRADEILAGYISAEFHPWNRLVQIHGIAVALTLRRRRLASRLMSEAEFFARSVGARGIFVDTPVTNNAARDLYLACGYSEAYRMPRYYSEDLDGIAFVKFFDG